MAGVTGVAHVALTPPDMRLHSLSGEPSCLFTVLRAQPGWEVSPLPMTAEGLQAIRPMPSETRTQALVSILGP